MKKRVLTWAWFGFHNLGDDLLLHAFIDTVAREDDISVSIAMNEQYNLDESVIQVKRSYKTLFSSFNYDCLIIGPGGLFPQNKTTKLIVYLMAVIWWRFCHKKVVFYGVGISNRLNAIQKVIWHQIIKCSDLFFPRNEMFLQAIGVRDSDTVHSIPDVAFSLNPNNNQVAIKSRIAIAIANLSDKDFKSSAYYEQISIWSEIIQRLLDLGKCIDLIAFTKQNDDVLIDELGSKFKNVHLIHYNEIENALNHWGEYEVVLAMRFHSVVLSIVNSTPFVPIAYGHKTINLVNKIGMDEYLIRWSLRSGYLETENLIEPTDVLEKIQCVLANQRIIISKLKEMACSLHMQSDAAFNELRDFLNSI